MSTKKICIPKNKMISEHAHLVKLLKQTSNILNKEMVKQSKELKEYRKGGKINKVHLVMSEFKKGNLISSSGRKVIKPKQAIAIALNQNRRY
jgi:hypothetical protein